MKYITAISRRGRATIENGLPPVGAAANIAKPSATIILYRLEPRRLQQAQAKTRRNLSGSLLNLSPGKRWPRTGRRRGTKAWLGLPADFLFDTAPLG